MQLYITECLHHNTKEGCFGNEIKNSVKSSDDRIQLLCIT